MRHSAYGRKWYQVCWQKTMHNLYLPAHWIVELVYCLFKRDSKLIEESQALNPMYVQVLSYMFWTKDSTWFRNMNLGLSISYPSKIYRLVRLENIERDIFMTFGFNELPRYFLSFQISRFCPISLKIWLWMYHLLNGLAGEIQSDTPIFQCW